jgi:hypothetical protein
VQKPEYLYHYTSIEGLAHILSSKSIRFSRLDSLDDTEEGASQDTVDWRKYFYVSCWAATSEESIPLWSMYTKNMTGVRIKVKIDMFKRYNIDPINIPKFMQIADTSSAPAGSKINIQSFMPYEEMHGEDYMVMPPSWQEKFWPFPIEYTDDESKLKQQLISYNPTVDKTSISTFEVAKYKRNVWKFQNEWRFRLQCFGAAPRSLWGKLDHNAYVDLMVKRASTFTTGINKECFYLALNEETFNDIEIVLGPKMEPAQRIIVDALVRSHCPSASIIDSTLAGRIK